MTTIITTTSRQVVRGDGELAGLEAGSISAWFGDRKLLDRASLFMPAESVTALIGPVGLRQVNLPPAPDRGQRRSHIRRRDGHGLFIDLGNGTGQRDPPPGAGVARSAPRREPQAGQRRDPRPPRFDGRPPCRRRQLAPGSRRSLSRADWRLRSRRPRSCSVHSARRSGEVVPTGP
jgi:hypothetical protein